MTDRRKEIGIESGSQMNKDIRGGIKSFMPAWLPMRRNFELDKCSLSHKARLLTLADRALGAAFAGAAFLAGAFFAAAVFALLAADAPVAAWHPY